MKLKNISRLTKIRKLKFCINIQDRLAKKQEKKMQDKKSTLQNYYDKRGRLPISQIKDEPKKFVGENKALKVFENCKTA